MTLLILIAYVSIMLGLGYAAYRRTRLTPQDFFLASGTLGPVTFPLTMFATLMSAFVFFGSGGWAYRHGFAWYAPIGVEAFLGVGMAIVGHRAWLLGRRHGFVTPAEMLGRLFGSEPLRVLVALLQLFWSVPYLSIQAVGGGHLFVALTEGRIPYWAGALLVTVLSGSYLLIGGMRSVAWTDVLQGLFLVVALAVALVYVVAALPVVELTQRLLADAPGLFRPEGAAGLFTPPMMFSFLLMNTLAILAYPQLFQRYFTARSTTAFKALALWWPPLTAAVALIPVLLGVWGRAVFPDLADADQVLPQLVSAYTPPWVGGVLLGGALAAMMSTKDSLLLTMSSIVSRDLYRLWGRRATAPGRELEVGRAVIVALLAASYALALTRPPSIVALAVYFIQGNALLAPTFLAALYWRRATAPGLLASVIVGQLGFAAAEVGLLPSFGFASFVPALALALFALAAGSLLSRARGAELLALYAVAGARPQRVA